MNYEDLDGLYFARQSKLLHAHSDFPVGLHSSNDDAIISIGCIAAYMNLELEVAIQDGLWIKRGNHIHRICRMDWVNGLGYRSPYFGIDDTDILERTKDNRDGGVDPDEPVGDRTIQRFQTTALNTVYRNEWRVWENSIEGHAMLDLFQDLEAHEHEHEEGN